FATVQDLTDSGITSDADIAAHPGQRLVGWTIGGLTFARWVAQTNILARVARRPGGPRRNKRDWCLDAAEQGPVGWRNFCNSLPEASQRAICFSKMYEDLESRRNYCRNW